MSFPMKITFENTYDLYRGTKITNPSPEHVVQAGLGGKLEVVGLIDQGTNTAFGGTIDKAITESLHCFRAMAGLLTRRGDPIRVVAESGDYDILGDFPVKKKSLTNRLPWTVGEQPNGKKQIKITAKNKEQALELAKHALRALKLPINHPIEIEAAHVRSFAPAIPIKFGLGGPLDLRAVAKSCVNALAVHLSPGAVLSGPFQKIRDYVLFGIDHCNLLHTGKADPHPAFACWDNRMELVAPLPEEYNLGPIDHRVIIRGCSAKHSIYATFELFGHLPISVLLTDGWTGADFCWGMITDPRPGGKGYWQGTLNLEYRPALSASTVMAHETEIAQLRPACENLVATLSKMLKDRARNDLVTECLSEALGPLDGRLVTEEMINLYISKLAERVIERMYRLESKTPIKLPPELLFPE